MQSQASGLDKQWDEIAGKGGPDRQRSHLVLQTRAGDAFVNPAPEGFYSYEVWTAPQDADQLPLNLTDNKLIANHRVLALGKRGNKVFVAMSDPSNEQVLQEVKFATGLNMEPIVVEDDKLDRLVKKFGDGAGKTLEIATEDVDLSGIELTDGEA